MKRKFDLERDFPVLGAISCIVYVLFKIICLFLSMFIMDIKASSFDIIDLGIDIVFYLVVASYFYKNRSRGNSTYAMLMLMIATYLLPFIMSIIDSLANLSFDFVIVGLFFFFGIIYSIILILNSKNEKKGYKITLLVLGILMTLIGIYNFIFDIYYLIYIFNQVGTTTSIIYLNSIDIFDAFISLMFYVLFMLYPIYLKKSSY